MCSASVIGPRKETQVSDALAGCGLAADLVDDTGGVGQLPGQGGLTGVYMRQDPRVQSSHGTLCPLGRW